MEDDFEKEWDDAMRDDEAKATLDKEWDDELDAAMDASMRDDNEAKAKIDKEWDDELDAAMDAAMRDDNEAKAKIDTHSRVIKRRPVKEKLKCSTISLSIVIRSHGSIDTNFSRFFPVMYQNEAHYKNVLNHFTNNSKINEVIPLFDYKNVGIDKLIDITPSKFGGSCYGNSDLRDLIVKSRKITYTLYASHCFL